jgi:hypothetical protein
MVWHASWRMLCRQLRFNTVQQSSVSIQTSYATPCCLHGVHAGGHLLKALTSRSCSCVFEAPPKSWFTSAPIALEGPAPSEPLHMSEPVTRVRRAMVLVLCCCLLLLTCQQLSLGAAL